MIRKMLIAALPFILSQAIFADCQGIPYAGFGGGMRDNIKNTKSSRGIDGNVFAGYGAMFNPAVMIGGEVFFTPGNMPVNNNGLRTTYGVGLSFLSGLLISDHTLAFMRVGFVNSHFTTGIKKSGGQLGLGLQTGLTQNWDLRAEYIYSAYGALKGIGAPKSDQAMMSLVYKFI